MTDFNSKAIRIQQILDQLMQTQPNSDALDSDKLIAEHPELMPELGEELKNLAAIEAGVQGLKLDGDHGKNSTIELEAHPSVGLQTGNHIGSFKIVSILGEGGFGIVYLAEQTKPIKRKVALKVIKPGMDSKAVIARFDAERQALAMMNHPNVAKVFDAGTTEQGQPYFVMELVTGVSITEHCDRHKLNIAERLNLFIEVCEAVQHAHQKGIIHRDIKPSNILVEYRNDKSICKVIDFGVAKAIEQRLTEQTIFTQQGQLIGTPAYMSPEQAEMTAQDIDTRSDIYSLGVVLYQLLTGVTPFETKTLMQAGWDEIRRVIREEEPQKPSTKLSSIGSEHDTDSATIARNRKTNPDTLSKHLRGDLDWVTIKALEKDRARRYATATELADDIRRHLCHEPVLASPPGSGYRFKKFIRRNKGPVTAVAAVMLALAAGLAATGYLYIQAENARAEIVVQRDNAKREAETAKQVQKFMIDLFKVSDPSEARGNTITAHEIMDKAAERIERELAGQPLIQATLLQTISEVYLALGLYDMALPLAQQALSISREAHGDEHHRVAMGLLYLAGVLKHQGKYTEAEKLQREALAMQRKFYGDESPYLANYLHNLANVLSSQGKYAEAEKLHREVLSMRRNRWGNENKDVAISLGAIASVLYYQGKLTDALKIHREALTMYRKILGDEHPGVARCLSNIATILRDQAKYTEAEKLFREALAMQRKLYGDEHPDVAISLSKLAEVFRYQAKYTEAEKLFREALAMQRKLYGDEHPDMARSLRDLAYVLMKQGKYPESESLNREVLAMRRKLLGDEHIDVADSLGQLAYVLERQGKYVESEKLHLEALAIRRKLLGDEHIDVARSLHNLALALERQGKYTESEKLYREALAMRRKLFVNEHSDVTNSLGNLHSVLMAQGKIDEARPFVAELLTIRRKLAEKPDASARTLNAYAWDLLIVEPADLRDPAAALPLAQKAVEKSGGRDPGILDTLALAQQMTGDINAAVETQKTAITLLPPGPLPLRTALETNLTKFLIEQGKYDEAEKLYREVLATNRRLFGNNHRYTWQSLYNLSVFLHEQGKLEEARPIDIELFEINRKLTEKPDATAQQLNNYAWDLLTIEPEDLRDPAAALSLAQQAVEKPGGRDPAYFDTLALAQQMTGEIDAAVETQKTAIALLPQGPSPRRTELETNLTKFLIEQESFDEAEPLILAIHQQLRDKSSSPRKQKQESLQRIIKLYTAWHTAEPNKGYDQKATEWRAKLPIQEKSRKQDIAVSVVPSSE